MIDSQTSWPAVEEVQAHANYNYRRYDKAAIRALENHRKLGISVVITSAIVSTSVFGALLQSNPIMIVQFGTGALSVIATVLAAVQAFYKYAETATEYSKTAVSFLRIRQQARLFLNRYYDVNSSDIERMKDCRALEDEIIQRFDEAKDKAPILIHAKDINDAEQFLLEELKEGGYRAHKAYAELNKIGRLPPDV